MINWSAAGFPVVDRASLDCELRGAALTSTRDERLVLIQQSSSGAVFAQYVKASDGTPEQAAPIQLK